MELRIGGGRAFRSGNYRVLTPCLLFSSPVFFFGGVKYRQLAFWGASCFCNVHAAQRVCSSSFWCRTMVSCREAKPFCGPNCPLRLRRFLNCEHCDSIESLPMGTPAVRDFRIGEEITVYRQFRKLADEWVDLSIQASRLRMRQNGDCWHPGCKIKMRPLRAAGRKTCCGAAGDALRCFSSCGLFADTKGVL